MEFSLFQWQIPLQPFQYAVAAVLVLLAALLLPRLYYIFRAYRYTSTISGPNVIFTILYSIKMALNGTTAIDSFNFLLSLPRLFPKSGIIRFWMGHKLVVMACRPEEVEIFLTREESLKRPPEMRLFLSVINMGNPLVLVNSLQEWRKRRKLLKPAFNMSIFESYSQVINKHSAIFVTKMKQRDSTHPINLLPNLHYCTMDIICEAAMGVDIESQKGKNVEFVEALNSIADIYNQRIFQPWLHLDFVFKCFPMARHLHKNEDIIQQTSRKIIAERKARMFSDPMVKKQIEENFVEGAKRMQVAMIDLMLYHHLHGQERYSDDDVCADVIAFIFGGLDTCALTLSWAFYLIGNDLRVQQAIHDELDTVLGNSSDSPVSAADIKNLKYLNCVFQETLRLYPPVGALYRYAHKDLQLNGYTIPAGTTCLISTDTLHRNPRYFWKPDSFLPERFLNKEERHPFTYIPFAAGPRNCFGQRFAHLESMIILASIMRNFSVKSANKMDKVRRGLQVSTAPVDPMHVYFTPRSP